KAISILKNGQKIDFEIGEDGGDNLNLSYYNITIKAELEKLAKADYEKRKTDGFTGSLTAFGIPYAHHGWKGNLKSVVYPDRNGLYFIEGVEKDFNTGGFRQILKF